MTTDQKAEALNALAEISLKLRRANDWYVDQQTFIKERGGCCLDGRYGNGISPEAAIDDHWRQLVVLKPNEYVVVEQSTGRRNVRWNGFMWDDVVL